MIYDWYKIINKTEFIAAGLPSRELTLILEGKGQVTVLVTQGRLFSLIYDGVMLSTDVTAENPFSFGGYAAYLDDNQDLWLGIPTS